MIINRFIFLRFLLALLLLFAYTSEAQQITLDSCISAARQNWPAFKKRLTISGQRQLISETLNKSYLPKLNLSGQATYQSEVVTFPEVPTMPGFFPIIPQDNYYVEVGISQIIWDGGTVKSAKEIQYATNDIEVQKLNVETYGLTGKINRLYTNYLYLTKSRLVLQVSENELEKNLTTLQSAFENGTLLKSDLDNIKAEKLKLQKEIITVESSRLNIVHSINLITGLNLDTTYRFLEPKIQTLQKGIRPELALMDARINYSYATISRFKTSRMPKFSAFGRAGYGRPGYDFLNTDLHGYYMVGARFTWEIFDWNLFKKQKQQVTLQQQIIKESKATLEKQVSLEESQYLFEIAQLTKQLELDREIIGLKKSVYQSAESQMNNGSITSTEYLKLFNEWKRARLITEMDKLKLTAAQLNYNHAAGNGY